MTRRRFFVIDAFTDRPFHGNPCLVVPEAQGLDEAQMLALASEMRMESCFILPATRPDADLQMRFFTRREEVAMSGHGTVAGYAALRELAPAAEGTALAGRPFSEWIRVRQETRAGVLAVELSHDSEVGPWVTADFGTPQFGASLPAKDVAEVLRIRPNEMVAGIVPQIVTTRLPLMVVAVVGPSTLAGITPDMEALTTLSRRRGVVGCVVFACPGVLPQSDLCARFFFPAVKPQEDIVSGAALAASCAYGVNYGLLARAEEAMYHSDQGYSLGRPNRARILVRTKGKEITGLKVRGRGVVVAEGQIHVGAT